MDEVKHVHDVKAPSHIFCLLQPINVKCPFLVFADDVILLALFDHNP